MTDPWITIPEARKLEGLEQLTTSDDLTVGLSPLGITARFTLARLPRQRCTLCKQRRVCFAVGIRGVMTGPALCAKCAGIR